MNEETYRFFSRRRSAQSSPKSWRRQCGHARRWVGGGVSRTQGGWGEASVLWTARRTGGALCNLGLAAIGATTKYGDLPCHFPSELTSDICGASGRPKERSETMRQCRPEMCHDIGAQGSDLEPFFVRKPAWGAMGRKMAPVAPIIVEIRAPTADFAADFSRPPPLNCGPLPNDPAVDLQ